MSDVDAGGVGGDGVPPGQDRSSTGGSDCRDPDAIGFGDCGIDRACDGSVLLPGAAVGSAAEVTAVGGSLVAASGFAAVLTEASVSCTGLGFADAADASGAAMLATLCRVARYPPAPAAPIQAAASAAKARRFETIKTCLLTGTDTS